METNFERKIILEHKLNRQLFCDRNFIYEFKIARKKNSVMTEFLCLPHQPPFSLPSVSSKIPSIQMNTNIENALYNFRQKW